MDAGARRSLGGLLAHINIITAGAGLAAGGESAACGGPPGTDV